MKEAVRLPPELKAKKQKNVSYTGMRDKVGTVHVSAQNVDKITKNVVPAKALRSKSGKRKREESEESPSKRSRGEEGQ